MKTVLTSLFVLLAVCLWDISAQSDQKAITLADQVIEAMGGMDNYNNTRYIQWNFFGRRNWIWDKWTGDVRCEVPANNMRITMNVNTKEGAVYMYDQVQTAQDSLDKFLEQGYRMWINDSYWLVMPFKLKDPGTTLRYVGQKQDAGEKMCEVIELTFADVGVTPDNKYWIYIDPATSLVAQWDYYRHYDDDKPRMSTPWNDYNTYGNILLSGGRGDYSLPGIKVYESLENDGMFNDVSEALIRTD